MLRDYALTNLTELRILLLLCCIGWWGVACAWLKPTRKAIEAGALAAIFQFWLGLFLDVGLTRLGTWEWRAMPFTYAGCPIDLHLDWSILWGFGFVWLSDRIVGKEARTKRAIVFVMSCVALTLCFDIAIHKHMLFLADSTSFSWTADIAFLTVTLSASLYLYRSIGLSQGEAIGIGRLRAIPPFLRTLIYVFCFAGFFYVVLPPWLEETAVSFGLPAALSPVPLLPSLFALVGIALGAWACWEFAYRGNGTPIPWDAPKSLVTSGPYAFVANPMQIAGLLLALAVLCQRPSLTMLAYLFDMLVMTVVVFRLISRDVLHARFGQAYEAWHSEVREFTIRLNPLIGKRSVLFYDTQCAFCRRWIGLLSKWLTAAGGPCPVEFAPLDGPLATELLAGTSYVSKKRTMVLVEPGTGQRLATRSRALLRVLGLSPAPFCLFAAIEAIPGATLVGDLAYRLVARARQGSCRIAASSR